MDQPLYIHAEDKVIVDAGTADTLTVVVVAEEFYDPAR
jgi:pantothenate kinase type III